MTTDQAKVEELFEAARSLAFDQRAAFLTDACGPGTELRAAVESLLTAHDAAGDFLKSPTVDPDLDPPLMFTPPGTVIDRYKLLESIGEGGYGAVFMAEQTTPVQRRVALKIIKAGMDTRQVIARFEAERQALALMDHPNIAKVFDAGVTDTGRPYFVMELVKGVSIIKYCDQHKLSPRARLELFVQVCQAVQHAHTKGIIHRDLKPSNVLVALYDGQAVPKVIDFGVAKATGQKLTEHTMFTGFGDVIGTLEYMSPEQAEMNQLDVDTRSDIYSLGVLLYELLTGSTPLENKRIRQVALMEALRFVREEEPPKPSTRLSTAEQLSSIAANRGLEPKKLGGLVRGELDWIVMRALEKDRTRRYETANGMARDIERYLNDEPVQACPPSAKYRFRKFARRNKAVLTTGAIIGVVLVMGTLISIWQAVRATRAERRAAMEAQRANTETRTAQAVNGFLNRDLLGQMTTWVPYNRYDRPRGELKIAAVLDRAAKALDGQFHDQPLVEAALRETLGDTYSSVNDDERARSSYERAVALRRAQLGEENRATVNSTEDLAAVTRDVALLTQVVNIRQRLFGKDDPDTLRSMFHLALITRDKGDPARAIQLWRQTLEAQLKVFGPDEPRVAWTMHCLAHTLFQTGGTAGVPVADDREIESLFRQALLVSRKANTEDWYTYSIVSGFAEFLLSRGRYADAETLLQDALPRLKQLPGASPEMVSTLTQYLVSVYQALGQPARALEVRRAWVRDQNPALARAAGEYASLLIQLDRLDEAESPLLLIGEIEERSLSAAAQAHALGERYNQRSQYAKAEPWFRRALAIRRAVPAGQPEQVADTLCLLAFVLRQQDKAADAEPLQREALSIYQKRLGNDHLQTACAAHDLAFLLDRLGGRDTEAEQLYRAALATRRRLVGNGDSSSVDTAFRLAQTLGKQEKFDEADALLHEGYAALVANEKSAQAKAFRPVLVQWIAEQYRAWSQPEKAAEWERRLPTTQPSPNG
jgi:serine/threonine protein kinase/tetratricopeptide (TPR) repeat protein